MNSRRFRRTVRGCPLVSLCVFADALLEPGKQALGESCWEIEGLVIADEADDVTSAFDDGEAVLAALKVVLHALAQLGADIFIKVGRDLPPYFDAAYFDDLWSLCHQNGLTL